MEIEEFLCESKSLCEINFSKIWVSKTTICKCEFKQWLKSKQWNFQKIELQSRSNHQNGNSWGKKCSNLISRKVWETDNSDFYTVCHDHEKYQCTMWKFRKFTLTHFWQKFRESNVFTVEIAKELIWRNFFSVRVNFCYFNFHYTAQCTVWKNKKFTAMQIFFRQINLTS